MMYLIFLPLNLILGLGAVNTSFVQLPVSPYLSRREHSVLPYQYLYGQKDKQNAYQRNREK